MRSHDQSEVKTPPQQAPAVNQPVPAANQPAPESDVEKEARRRHELALRNAEIARLNSETWGKDTEIKRKLVKDANDSTPETSSLSLGEGVLGFVGLMIILAFSMELAVCVIIAYPLIKMLGEQSRSKTINDRSKNLMIDVNKEHKSFPKPEVYVPDVGNANSNRYLPGNNGSGLRRNNVSSDGNAGTDAFVASGGPDSRVESPAPQPAPQPNTQRARPTPPRYFDVDELKSAVENSARARSSTIPAAPSAGPQATLSGKQGVPLVPAAFQTEDISHDVRRTRTRTRSETRSNIPPASPQNNNPSNNTSSMEWGNLDTRAAMRLRIPKLPPSNPVSPRQPGSPSTSPTVPPAGRGARWQG